MPLPQTPLSILLVRIDASQVGFSTSAVREILRAVTIAPLPGAPRVIEGAINLRGRIVPVVDVRHRFGLAQAPLSPEHFLIVLHASKRLIAVRVDDVEDIIELAGSAFEEPSSVSPVLEGLQGVAATNAGAIVVYDVDAFLTQAEGEALDLAASVAS